MSSKGMQGMLTTVLSSFKLKNKGFTRWLFIIILPSIKFLRFLGKFLRFRYLFVPYNNNLKYLIPLDQSCDWYHVTTEVLAVADQFEPNDRQLVVDVEHHNVVP